MDQRELGRTGMPVSILGFGASHVGAANCTEQDADRMLNEVLDLGITLIDTARGYGTSEERIGKFLAHRRSEYILSSKCGYGLEGIPDWTGECVRLGIDEALSRMRTDCIDIMHLHSCPRDVLKNGGVVEALITARDQGKIRAAAYSGENAHRAYAIETGSFDVIQTSVNICDQRVITEALPVTAELGIGVIAKRPVANAFWRFSERPVGDYSEIYWDRQQQMGLNPGDLNWTEFALRFTAYQSGVHSCIAGTANLTNLRANIASVGKGPLPETVVAEIRSRFAQYDQDWAGQV